MNLIDVLAIMVRKACKKINTSHAHAHHSRTHDSRTTHSHEHRASNGAMTLNSRTRRRRPQDREEKHSHTAPHHPVVKPPAVVSTAVTHTPAHPILALDYEFDRRPRNHGACQPEPLAMQVPQEKEKNRGTDQT